MPLTSHASHESECISTYCNKLPVVMRYRQMSCETVWPQALSDHRTHGSGTLDQILGHTDPLGVVHSALGHRME